MVSTNLSNTSCTLAQDIESLASIILKVMCDQTIEFDARGWSLYYLQSLSIPFEEIKSLVEKPGANVVLRKLLLSSSDFMGPTPRTVGVDLVSQVSSAKIQQSLDVKHVKRSKVDDDDEETDNRILPMIKIDLMHTHAGKIWFRFYTYKPIENVNPDHVLIEIYPNVYEYYISKKPVNGRTNASSPVLQYKRQVIELIKKFETEYAASMIFCSEISLFVDHPLVFLTNYIRFMWCYSLNRCVYDPVSHEDHGQVGQYFSYGLMFLNTNNLTYMPKSTHGPLPACSGERPKVALAKFKESETQIVDGSRSNQCMDKPSDFGTVSNYIEVTSFVNIESDSWISNII